jgi:hypothetical protein
MNDDARNHEREDIIYKFGSKRLRGKTRNRWKDEVKEDGSLVGGKG